MDGGVPDAVISDTKIPAHERAALYDQNVSIHYLSEWTSERMPGDWINTHQLHQWLTEALSPLTTT
jgi:hypothetical protein